jgi:phospholipid transport system substrate-binding protein
MKRSLAVLAVALWSAVAAAAVTPPDQIVRENTDKILSLIKTNRDAYAKDYGKMYAMVDEYVLPHFDFSAMSRLVLARAWRDATEQQRTRFTQEFRDLLVRTYATVLLKYNDEKIKYLPFRMLPEERTQVVKVEVQPAAGGPPIPITYSFYQPKPGEAWKVFDVTVDGVSLVTNYRATYADRVRNEGLDALIASLAKDNKEGKTSSPALGSKGATKK